MRSRTIRLSKYVVSVLVEEAGELLIHPRRLTECIESVTTQPAGRFGKNESEETVSEG